MPHETVSSLDLKAPTAIALGASFLPQPLSPTHSHTMPATAKPRPK